MFDMMFHYMKMFLPHKGNILFAKRLAHNLQDSTVNKNQLQGIQHAELLLYRKNYVKFT